VSLFEFVLNASLKCKHGGILKKHHGKSTHQAVMQAVVDLTILPAVIGLVEMLR